MRRPLARATAACTASVLALSLWTVAPATAGEEVPSEVEGTTLSKKRGNPAGHDGGPVGAVSPTSMHSDADRIETEISHWTYVDRAFPEQAYDDVETTSVGTGRLEWDRVYTRRALFRFPIELAPGAVVDSAVLRTGVSWSYDCHGQSHVQLHRVDPFGTGTTWNDQPAERALLDTRNVDGGRAGCLVDGGVEFDATEAYQWAVDNDESHLDLRLKESSESDTTAWRRFRVADAPPVLVVEHSTPPPRGGGSDPSGSRHSTASEDSTPDPPPSDTTEALAPTGDRRADITGTDDFLAVNLVPADRTRAETGRARSRGWGAADHLAASKSRRQRDGDRFRRSRGPPVRTMVGDRTQVRGHKEPVDGHRPFPSPGVAFR